MERPDLKKLHTSVLSLYNLEERFLQIFKEQAGQERAILALSTRIRMESVSEGLADISVDELAASKAGIPVEGLKKAGYENLRQLSKAADLELRAIDGIGEKKVQLIRQMLTEFSRHLAEYETIRLSADEISAGRDVQQGELIRQIAIYRKCELIRRDAMEISGELHAYTERIRARKLIRNGFSWFFSGREAKELTVLTAAELFVFYESPLFERTTRFISLYQKAQATGKEEALADFTRNAAAYYVLLERLGGSHIRQELIYDSVPEQLAAQIRDLELDLSLFRGDLRAYQLFGTKYVLQQKRVLLGDEMGLGKTIQAIALMAHLYAADPRAHFLIVCPASVLVNWCREIGKFSGIPVMLLHGSALEHNLSEWQMGSGAAVTNYESLGRIVDAIDNRMRMELMVIDEAHYIKNPDAQRTKRIRRIEDESERVLLMTGTPLENHVEEMCSLIELLQPDMSEKIRGMANLSQLRQFREALAPVYLRRTRQQVLKELPPVEEEREWCQMTAQDFASYSGAVQAREFNTLRRVSFIQDDLKASAKAARLLELCDQARSEGRRVVVFSYYRETIDKIEKLLGSDCAGVITGETKVEKRQFLIDRFSDDACAAHVLVCQVQAGGTGLNIQAASIVIFAEPQVKPSLTNQALSRVYRMGQVRSVLVYHLLCPGSVDEAMVLRLEEKQAEFDAYADESAMAEATEGLFDNAWIKEFMESESRKLLPMVIQPS